VTESGAELVALLRGTPLAHGLDDQQLAEIAACLRPMQAGAGRSIVREGDLANCWYVITEGTANVWRCDLVNEPVTLALLGPGQSFGEGALLPRPLPRSASVTAVSDVAGFAVEGAEFRTHVSTASTLGERLQHRLDVMSVDTALKRASPFASLPHAAVGLLVERLSVHVAQPGDFIIRQGDAGDCLFVIRSGRVQVTQDTRMLAVLGAGDSFGEVSLVTGKPRTASVRALEPAELLVLQRDDFLAIAREHVVVAAYFRELFAARLPGALNQPLLLPDPLSTMMPRLAARGRKRYWVVVLIGILIFGLLTAAARASDDPAVAYALTVFGALIVPVVFVQYLAESNILAERPLELLATGALGAALGLPPAYVLQHASGLIPGSFTAALLIATIE
jgi:CRP-like cAMP-binding protein